MSATDPAAATAAAPPAAAAVAPCVAAPSLPRRFGGALAAFARRSPMSAFWGVVAAASCHGASPRR